MVANCVHITQDFCYASDGYKSLRIGIEGPRGVDVCVDAGMLHDILVGLPDDAPIDITPGAGFITLKSGARRIKVRTLPSDGMPQIKSDGDFVELKPEVVSAALKFVHPAIAARNVASPFLCNAVIEFSRQGTYVVGCDGFRLHAYKVDGAASAHDMICAIPGHTIKQLAGLCESGGRLRVNRHRIILNRGDLEFVLVLGESVYANWRRIVADKSLYQCTVNLGRAALRSAIDSAIRLGAEWLDLLADESGLSLSADLKGDSFSDHLAADVQGTAEDISLNPRFLLDLLSVHTEDIITLSLPPKVARRTLFVSAEGCEHITMSAGRIER